MILRLCWARKVSAATRAAAALEGKAGLEKLEVIAADDELQFEVGRKTVTGNTDRRSNKKLEDNKRNSRWKRTADSRIQPAVTH